MLVYVYPEQPAPGTLPATLHPGDATAPPRAGVHRSQQARGLGPGALARVPRRPLSSISRALALARCSVISITEHEKYVSHKDWIGLGLGEPGVVQVYLDHRP